MTHEELTTRVAVLEERLARQRAILALLLEAIATGSGAKAARGLRELLDEDLEGDSEG